MNKEQRKLLLQEYKDRKPEMGVISFCCTATGDTFLGISKDIKADYNSTACKLRFGYHPNRKLLTLWNTYGEEKFEMTTLRLLDYEDPKKDHTNKLEELREECLAQNPQAQKLWR